VKNTWWENTYFIHCIFENINQLGKQQESFLELLTYMQRHAYHFSIDIPRNMQHLKRHTLSHREPPKHE
jgi:hypothetical protein